MDKPLNAALTTQGDYSMPDKKQEDHKIDIEKIPFWDILKILRTGHIFAIMGFLALIFSFGYKAGTVGLLDKKDFENKNSAITTLPKTNPEQIKKEQEYLLRKKIALSEIGSKEFDEKRAQEDINALINPSLKTEAYTWKSKCEKIIGYSESYFIERKKYKEVNAMDAISICEQAKNLNPNDFKYTYLLAIAYHKNQDYEKTVFLLKDLALQGYTVAQRKIGIMYLLGNLVEANPSEGKKWLLKAAENGDNAAKKLIDSSLF